MPIVVNDPIVWIMVDLGWSLGASVCILLVALVLRIAGRILPSSRGIVRSWSLVGAILIYIVGVTVVNVLAARQTVIDWESLFISYVPVLGSPLLSFLGYKIWPK